MERAMETSRPDATLSPPAIRSERKQNGNGRVYTIDFKALDPLGGTCTGVVRVVRSQSPVGKVLDLHE